MTTNYLMQIRRIQYTENEKITKIKNKIKSQINRIEAATDIHNHLVKAKNITFGIIIYGFWFLVLFLHFSFVLPPF